MTHSYSQERALAQLGALNLLNVITPGNALDLLPKVPDQCCALAFADPPYWVGYDYGDGRRDQHMAYIDPAWLVSELRRIARFVCVTTGMRNVYDYPRPDWLIGWFKPGSTRRSDLGGFNTWEPIYVYGKGKTRLWQDSVYLPDVANHTKEGAFHKCPKPVKLLTYLIDGLTRPGDTVIDPVMGSGTTAVACKMLGRNFIGFEIDEDTARKANRRVEEEPVPLIVIDEVKQQELF